MGVQELLGKMIEERVDQIIGERLPGLRARYYEEQEAILRSLDPDTRDQFERLFESLVEGGAATLTIYIDEKKIFIRSYMFSC